MKKLKISRYNNGGIQIPLMYMPIGAISEEEVYKDGEINALIHMLYDTTEICGYTIINKYKQSGFSIVMKPGARPVILNGEVFDIHFNAGLVEIHTRETGPDKIYGRVFPNGAMYIYILKKDLTQKIFIPNSTKGIRYNIYVNCVRLVYNILAKLKLFNCDVRQEAICKIYEIDKLVFHKDVYSVSLCQSI